MLGDMICRCYKCVMMLPTLVHNVDYILETLNC